MPSTSDGKEKKEIWNLERLKMYFAYCRQLDVAMSPDASKVISKYYNKIRQLELAPGAENLPRTNTRLLPSLIRLAEG